MATAIIGQKKGNRENMEIAISEFADRYANQIFRKLEDGAELLPVEQWTLDCAAAWLNLKLKNVRSITLHQLKSFISTSYREASFALESAERLYPHQFDECADDEHRKTACAVLHAIKSRLGVALGKAVSLVDIALYLHNDPQSSVWA